MNKDPIVFLKHIVESIDLIKEYTKQLKFFEFKDSIQLQDSIIRRLEIIGEAIKSLPKTLTGKYTDVPWREIAGLRDVLIHQYFGIDLELTWEVIEKDIPELEIKIKKIIEDLEKL